MSESPAKILLVDDEPDITYIVEFILTHGGFEVHKINDSTLALDELTGGGYALLVLDLMMPKKDGFTLLEEIRRVDELKGLPILILSSRLMDSRETKMLEDHSARIMAKPFDPPRLLDKVREIVSGGSS